MGLSSTKARRPPCPPAIIAIIATIAHYYCPSLSSLPIIATCEVKVNCMGAVRGQIRERASLCTQDLTFNEIGLKCSCFCHQRCYWKKNSFTNLNLLINSHGWYEESLTLLSFTGIRLNTANPSLSTGKDFLMHSLGKD